jgi:hypothetical protein
MESENSMGGGSPSTQDTTLRHMLAAKRWLVYASDKQPFYIDGTPRRGALDTDEDRGKLASYQEACVAAQASNGRFGGIGFALGPDGAGCWQGIDLDEIPNGQLDQWAAILPGYVEVSPSGKGLHAIGYGAHFRSLGSNGTGFEAYASGRYFTFTGSVKRDGALVCLSPWVQGPVAARHSAQRPTTSAAGGAVYVDPKTVTELRSALNAIPADDYHVWIRMGCALCELAEGRELWLSWSQQSSKWKPVDAKKWDTFRSDRTGYQAVFAEAHRNGWTNPGSNAAQITMPPPTILVGDVRLLTDKDLQDLPPQRWIVKGIIPATGVGTVYGPPKTFKSFLNLDLLAHISNGWDWFGFRVRAAPCVYVPFEGKGGIPRRVAAWRLAMARRANPDALMIAGPVDEITTNMRFITDPINLRNKMDRDSLCETLNKSGWSGGVLCIDTLASAGGSIDENSSEGMGEMVTIFQELQHNLGGVVDVVHHSGKDPTKGMRGWSGLSGAIDFSIECRRVDEGDKYQAQFVLDKVKDGEDGRVIDFKMERVFLGQDDDGDDTTSLVVMHPTFQPVTESLPVRLTDAEQDTEDDRFIWEWVCGEVKAGNYPSVRSLQGQLNLMKEQRPMTQKRVRDAVDRLKARTALVTEPKSPSGNPWLLAVEPYPDAPK